MVEIYLHGSEYMVPYVLLDGCKYTVVNMVHSSDVELGKMFLHGFSVLIKIGHIKTDFGHQVLVKMLDNYLHNQIGFDQLFYHVLQLEQQFLLICWFPDWETKKMVAPTGSPFCWEYACPKQQNHSLTIGLSTRFADRSHAMTNFQ